MENQNRLWNAFKSFLMDFRELGRAVGMTLDHYMAAFLSAYLEEKGYPVGKISMEVDMRLKIDDRTIEVGILNEDLLIIGEATTYIRSLEEAEAEVGRLIEKKKLVESFYGRKAEITVLAVANIDEGVLEALRRAADKEGITVFAGRELKHFTHYERLSLDIFDRYA